MCRGPANCANSARVARSRRYGSVAEEPYFLAVRDRFDFVTGRFERARDIGRDPRVVLDNKNVHHFSFIRSTSPLRIGVDLEQAGLVLHDAQFAHPGAAFTFELHADDIAGKPFSDDIQNLLKRMDFAGLSARVLVVAGEPWRPPGPAGRRLESGAKSVQGLSP
jgi:hypothetical protein